MDTMAITVWIVDQHVDGEDIELFGTREEADTRFVEIVQEAWNCYDHHWEPPLDGNSPQEEAINAQWWADVEARYAPGPVPDVPQYPGFDEAFKYMWDLDSSDTSCFVRSLEVLVPIPKGLAKA